MFSIEKNEPIYITINKFKENNCCLNAQTNIWLFEENDLKKKLLAKEHQQQITENATDRNHLCTSQK